MPDPPGPCVHPDVGAYALGLLDAEELSAYERHLSGCVQCARTLEGLAPLVELLGQVDAASLLAGPDRGRVHRFAAHPPGAVGTLFPRQREPSHDRVRRPHLRAWDELDDRFRGPDRAAPAGVASGEAELGPPGVAPREAEQAGVAPREAELGPAGVAPREAELGPAGVASREAEQASVAPREAEQRRPHTAPRPARRRRSGPAGNSALVRRLVLVAAALTVVMMLSLVTIAARSSVTDPATVAEAPPAPGPVAATTAAPPRTTPPAARQPAAPPRRPTAGPTAPPAARTKKETKPAPGATGPDTLKADPGVDAEGDRLAGRDPATGATAEVRLTRTAAGLDVALTVTNVAGPRECVLRVIATDGTAGTALRWRVAAGEDRFSGLGSTTVERAAIDRFELVDDGGAVLVTINSR